MCVCLHGANFFHSIAIVMILAQTHVKLDCFSYPYMGLACLNMEVKHQPIALRIIQQGRSESVEIRGG